MLPESERQKRREENKQLKEYLRKGHQPEIKGNFFVFPSGKQYTLHTTKRVTKDGVIDVYSGLRRAKNELK